MPQTAWLGAAIPVGIICIGTGLVLGINAPPGAGLGYGVAAALLAWAACVVGQAVLRAAHASQGADLDFLVGVTLLAYALTVPVVVAGTNIAIPAAAYLLLALGLRLGGWAPTSERVDRTIWPGLLAAVGFAVIWSLDTTARFSTFPEGGIWPLALDAPMHGGNIAELGDWRMVGRGSASMADGSYGLYHFASYGFPALAVRLAGIEPLFALPRVWISLGAIVMALGFHALGRALAGTAGGALAVLLLAATPDPASYGLAQSFFSFHWLLEVSPGSLYGLGTIAASLCLLVCWAKQPRWGLLMVSAVLLALTFLLRAHLLLWCMVPWAAVVLAGWPSLSRRWKLGLSGLAIAAIPLVLIWAARAEIERIGFARFLGGYLHSVHGFMTPHGAMGVQQWLVANLGLGGAAPFGSLLALAAMGGVPLATFLLGSILLRRRLTAIDAFPFALIAWALLLMVLAPTPFHGDNSDLRQRGFLALVMTLLIWNARWVAMAWPGVCAMPVGLAACAALVVTWLSVFAWKAPHEPNFESFRSTPVAPSIAAGAAWLRSNALPDGSFVVAVQDASSIGTDDGTFLMALSGQPAWLSRPGIQLRGHEARAAMARHRLGVLAAVLDAPDLPSARALLCREGVSFYVVTGENLPRWDPTASRAAFRAPGLFIWRIETPAGEACRKQSAPQ